MIRKKKGQLLPAYPLFVKDPYFSFWSPADRLNAADTVFWTGARKRLWGVVQEGEKCYSFLGDVPGCEKLTQTSVGVSAFDTEYTFTCDRFDLSVTFTSPLPPDDLLLLSCPVCYFRYTLTPKTVMGETTVALFLDEEACYDREKMDVRAGKHILTTCESAWMGLRKQLPMSQSFDSSSAEWGYWFLSGTHAMYAGEGAVDRFLSGAPLAFSYTHGERIWLAAYDVFRPQGDTAGMMTIAFDDTCSIYYFGEWLRGYHFEKTGKTISEIIVSATENANQVFAKCEKFDRKVRRMAAKYGKDYLLVLYAGLRQSVGAHKLATDREKNLLFLSKENHSNGCIATVDVSYPSMPLYLLFNPALVRAMCEPILRFARMPVWGFDFAPHDAGTYPYCCGQLYGLDFGRFLGTECATDLSVYPRFDGDVFLPANNPLYHTFPEKDLYDFTKQMPVEECGNMLIMLAAAMRADGKTALIEKNWDLLEKWVAYLVRYGLVPGNQLCTDDFAGHLDQNCNLSVKAIVGIAAYALMAEKLGKTEEAKEMMQTAKKYAAEWKRMCRKNGKTPLTFDGDAEATFSLKYNMAFDVLFGTGLFDKETRESEIDRYIALQDTYGVPLDSRSTYTKSDWILWCTALTADREKRRALIAPVARYLKKSPSRVPFSDWYFTDTGKMRGFQNRSVQGGVFLPLLTDKWGK